MLSGTLLCVKTEEANRYGTMQLSRTLARWKVVLRLIPQTSTKPCQAICKYLLITHQPSVLSVHVLEIPCQKAMVVPS